MEARWVERVDTFNSYDPAVHWNPQIYVENAVVNSIKETFAYETHKQPDGSIAVTEKRRLKGADIYMIVLFLSVFLQKYKK